jgi:crotonobetainyl-CoA:carnitine CoA-transferase CaiB-like acyl-CoA transferase
VTESSAGERRAGPLDGIVVADFSRVVAGPYATMLLGDLGADVIKVERPGAGDDTRGFGPPFVDGESSYYLAINRNKRGVEWDLGTPEGRRKAQGLAARADVVVENFRPGTADRFGLGYEAVAVGNPKVVYCSVSGFGTTGAGAALPGYDFLVQGVGGLMSITGDAAGEPRKVGVAVVDVLTAQFAANAIVAALYERERSGRGQRVEVNLLSSLLSAMINQAATYLTTGRVPQAMGNRHPSIAPYETVRASDRLLIVAVGNDSQFAALTGVVGAEWMATDPRFARNAARVEHRAALVAELEDRLSERPAAEWVERLLAAGIPAGVVNDIAEAFELAESVGLEPVVRIPRPLPAEPAEPAGAAPSPAAQPSADAQVAHPVRYSRTPASYRVPPPRQGEHTAEVEAEFGLT